MGSEGPRPGIDELAARFEACAIPAAEWTHEAHLIVGLWHVDRYGADEALVRLRSGIRRLNESQGGVNSATDGYHETITAAYVQLLAQYLDICPDDRRSSIVPPACWKARLPRSERCLRSTRPNF